ncbi:MAG: glutathione S-transferase, partial [Sphingomonadaceae bacterium]|nr:glutathione S-transferase [Sphingomonadaceae bacterium]
MKLYQSVGPNPRVPLMFIEEKGVDLDRRFIDLQGGENRQEEYLTRNPFGQTPALELDDGSALFESVAICEYLEERHPEPVLIGSTPEERAETRMLVRRIDFDIVMPLATAFRGAEGLPMFKDRMRCVPEGADTLKACARDGMAAFDKWLEGREW